MTDRNPDLPILDELGAEFEALVGATVGWPRASGSPAGDSVEYERHAVRRRAPGIRSRAARERRSQAKRVGRRAAIVLVLVCLVGGGAYAALRGGGSDPRAHTAPAALGDAADGAWVFSVYRDGGRLCSVFVPRGGDLSGHCGIAPRRDRAWAASAIAGGRRYVFGLVGPGVARVEASLRPPRATPGDRQAVSGPARPPVDPGATQDAGLPAGDRWFVLDLGPIDRPGPRHLPVAVTPFDRQGRRAGPPYVDCSLGIIGEAYRNRIQAAAAPG